LTEEDGNWVTHTAEGLVRDILKQMAGIQIQRLPQIPDVADGSMDVVCGHIYGDYHMEVQLRAQPQVFSRITRGIGGHEPEDEGEVEEYATEFFNVVCGRFISEICNRKHIFMRFNPPEYQKAARRSDLAVYKIACILPFRTDEDELFEFLWGKHYK
jgi:hypothetical protein